MKYLGLIEEINVLSDDLPINQLDFTAIYDGENTLDVSRKDRITVSNGKKDYGTFFVTDSKRTGRNTYDIVAQNLVGVLENEQYPDWVSNNVTILQSFAESLNSNIKIDATSDYTLFGYLPIVTKRFALCAAGWACGFMIDGSRSDKIYFKKIPTEISSTILTSDRRIIGDAVLEASDPIYSANIVYPSHMDYESDEISLTAPEDTVNYHLWDDAPIKINSASGNVVYYGESDNYVEYKAENESIKFYLTKYKYSNSVETVINSALTTTDIDEGKTKEYKDFQMRGGVYNDQDWVDDISRSADVRKYIQSLGKVKAKIILHEEKVGDLIQIETAWDGIVTGIITKMQISFGYDDIADIEVLEWTI